MKALSDAIQKRRQKGNALPAEPQGLMGKDPAASPAPQAQGPTAEEMIAVMAPEEKAKMFEMLKEEVEGAEGSEDMGAEDNSDQASMEDSAGELKSTSGEKAALSNEMNMDVANELADPRFTGDESEKPRNLGERVKMNIAKALKRRG